MKRAIDKLRDLVRAERYQISVHANEEMAIDFLIAIDVENAILNGSITKKLTKDPRGTRYEITGRACDGRSWHGGESVAITGQARDGRSMSVICRIVSGEWLRIVTVFALGDEA